MAKYILQFLAILAVNTSLPACSTTQQTENAQQEVMSVLEIFLHAFENGDLEAMEAIFADDATDFPCAIMSNTNISPIDYEGYKRVNGLDPQMRQLISIWHAGSNEPPYLSLEPRGLEIMMFSDAALVTFHLIDGDTLSRRSIVLAKRTGEWKIVHLHASNVASSG